MLSEEQREVIVKAIDAVGWRPTTEEGQQYIDELRDSLRGMLVASAAPAEGREPTDAEILALNEGEVYFSETPTRFPEAGHGTQYHCGAPGLLKFARAVRALGKSKPAEGRLTERQTTEIFHAAKNAETYRDFMRVLPDIIADAREAVDERALSEIAVYLKDEADHAEYVSQNNNDGDVPTEQAKAIATLRDWARAVMKARAALATAPTKDADDFDANAGSTGGKEADRIINRLMSSDPDFDDCADTADLIARLREADKMARTFSNHEIESTIQAEAADALTRLSQRVQQQALEYVSLFDQCSEAQERVAALEAKCALLAASLDQADKRIQAYDGVNDDEAALIERVEELEARISDFEKEGKT